jgi:hypothetical protein
MARPEVTGRKINAKTEREIDELIPGPSEEDEPEEGEPEQVDTDEAAASGPGRLRPEVTARKIGVKAATPNANRARGPPATDADADAFSIAEFCRRHGISPQLFYKFKHEMPVTFRVGTRVLISREAAAAWRRERETAARTTVEDTAA